MIRRCLCRSAALWEIKLIEMIVDFHTHTFPDKIAAATIEKLSRMAHIHPFTDGTAEGLKRSMADAGVTYSVVLPVATNPRQVAGINRAAAAVNDREEGLISFGCTHPELENWKEELDQAARLGLKGIKIHPAYQMVDQNDIRYLRILERAGELGLIVVTHSGLDIGFPGAEQCAPRKIAEAVRQVGPVQLVAAHMGGWRQWKEAEQLAEFTNVYLDTSFSTGSLTPRSAEDAPDTALELMQADAFLHMVSLFGVHRILFGTDSPWSDQRESIRWLQDLPLPAADCAAILGANAQGLLQLKK